MFKIFILLSSLVIGVMSRTAFAYPEPSIEQKLVDASCNDLPGLIELLKQKPNLNFSLDVGPGFYKNPLATSIACDNLEILNKLIEEGASPNWQGPTDAYPPALEKLKSKELFSALTAPLLKVLVGHQLNLNLGLNEDGETLFEEWISKFIGLRDWEKENSIPFAEELLKKGANPNTFGSWAPIMTATAWKRDGKYPLMELLEKHGARYDVATKTGTTFLLHLIGNRSIEDILTLMHLDPRPNVMTSDGRTVLHHLSKSFDGNRFIQVEPLLSALLKMKMNLNPAVPAWDGLLCYAYSRTHPEETFHDRLFAWLVEHGMDIKKPLTNGATLFRTAMTNNCHFSGRPSFWKSFFTAHGFKAGSEIPLEDFIGFKDDPLSQLEILVSITGIGSLTEAIRKRPDLLSDAQITSYPFIQYLVSNGANPETLRGTNGLPIWAAAEGDEEGFLEFYQFMIHAGLNINQQDAKGMTALHHLVWRKRVGPEIIEVLLQMGASPCLRTFQNKLRPLDYLHSYWDTGGVRTILKAATDSLCTIEVEETL
ncbi:MAG TPA: hypothetical protein VNJ01_14275 [Bacteriovoracaceae bacterium]|nr:hypothetical protein [Bacteriovoracaceae bacterium]